MIPLFAVLPLLGPQVTRVCPEGCPYATLQEAVDDVPENGSRTIGIDAEILDGSTRIVNRDITILPFLTPLEIGALLLAIDSQDVEAINTVLETLDTVTLTNSSTSGEATLTTTGGSLTLLGIAVDGGLARAVEATDTEVSLAVTTLFGRGIASDGGLLRVERGSLDVFSGGMRGGSAAGQGGLVAVYDADATISLTSLSDGSGARGACLSAESAGPERHTIRLNQTSFRACEGSLQGGAMHLVGPVTLELTGSTVSDSSAGQGGGIALIGPDVQATLVDTIVDSCVAFDLGGGIYVQDASLTLDQVVLSRDTAFYGGGLASEGRAVVTSTDVQFSENSAVFDGGGLHIGGGSYTSTDAVILDNLAGEEGGGLWLGNGAVWMRDVRSTLCRNRAEEGGGMWVDLEEGVTLSNLRLLDNIADLDGGGLYHAGEPLQLSFANLLGNAAGRGSGAAALTKNDLVLREAAIAYNLGAIAVVPRRIEGSPALNGRVEVGPSLWFANERGDMDGLSPTDPDAMFVDPLLNRYVPGDDCLLAQDWPTWSSPMHRTERPDFDGGDPERLPSLDFDGTLADMGAYGGPLAFPEIWETDDDGDLVPQIYDCDDGNPLVNPTIEEDTPYDGIDADCALDDDFDGDRDGFRRDIDGGTDCDDDEALVYPGAPEDPFSTVDANCDGLLDADGDGFERATNANADAGKEIDCDDANPSVYPGAPELGPNTDYNCDGFVDGPRIYGMSGCATGPAFPVGWLLSRRR